MTAMRMTTVIWPTMKPWVKESALPLLERGERW